MEQKYGACASTPDAIGARQAQAIIKSAPRKHLDSSGALAACLHWHESNQKGLAVDAMCSAPQF